MHSRRPTSQLSFEPLLPGPSDVVIGSSDSEDELDEASRTAKRRKIKQLARDYLNGRPPFILSASLKGPLENGWVNPWREIKTKPKKQEHYESLPENKKLSSKEAPKASAVPETASEYSRDDITSRASAQPSRSATPRREPKTPLASYSKLFHSNGPAATTGITKTSENIESSRRSVSQVSSGTTSRREQSSVKQVRDPSHGSSKDAWLKKNKKRVYLYGAGSRLSSPTPAARPSIPQQSNKSSKPSHVAPRFYGDGSDTNPRIHGFTAVNMPIPRLNEDTSAMDQPPLPTITNGIKRPSQLRVNSAYKKNDSQTGSKTQSAALNPQEDAQQQQGIESPKERAVVREPSIKPHKSPSNTSHMTLVSHPSTDVSKPLASSKKHDQARNSTTECPPDNTETNKTQETGVAFCDSAIPPPSSKDAEAVYSAVTESDHIPPAQIVPGYYRSETHITPLDSLEFLTTNGQNTHQDQDAHNSDSHTLSNQAKATAPEILEPASGKEGSPPLGVTCPGIKPNKRLRRMQSMPLSHHGPIKPFRSFHEDVVGTGETKSHDGGDKARRQKTDITATHDMDASKKLRFNRQPSPTIPDSKARAASPDKACLDRKRSSPASHTSPTSHSTKFKKAKRVASLPSLSLNTSAKSSQSTGILKFSPQEIMSILQRGGPSDIHSSSGTPLAFTLPESTQNTKQDGQGNCIKLQNFENFDLSKAIEDAGSFLQSWDVERDVQRLRNGEKLSAASETLKEPMTSALKKVR